MDLPKGYRIEFKNPTPIEYDKIRNSKQFKQLLSKTIK